MIEPLSIKQKLALLLLTFFSFGSIFAIGIALNALLECTLLLVVFIVINSLLVVFDKKIHAPALGKVPALVMCYFCTNLIFLLCITAMKYAAGGMPQWQAYLVGGILISFVSVILSGIFYGNPASDMNNITQFRATNKRKSNYDNVFFYIEQNPICEKLERYLEMHVRKDNFLLNVYICIFQERMNWEEAESYLQVNRNKIFHAVDKIAHGIRVSCNIPPE